MTSRWASGAGSFRATLLVRTVRLCVLVVARRADTSTRAIGVRHEAIPAEEASHRESARCRGVRQSGPTATSLRSQGKARLASSAPYSLPILSGLGLLS